MMIEKKSPTLKDKNKNERSNKMKDYEVYIFDLDYTILIPDWSKEDDYLKERIPLEEQERFFKEKQDILNEYEQTFPKYDFKTLSFFFKEKGFTVTEETIEGWMYHNGETIKDEVVDGVIELFKHLKEKGKTIKILTSWFSGTQIPRLKRAGIYEYIDEIIAGEDAMKPKKEAFLLAVGKHKKEDCLVIGDSYKSDKLGAENAGIDCYLVDKEHTIRQLYEQIIYNEKNTLKYSLSI